MLITRRKGSLCLVDQVEHGRLAGELAARWGNERFAAPTPRDSVLLAAEIHDEGWREPDERPLFNAAHRRPLHFLEIDMTQHVPLYRRGVDRAFAADPYAGLLVSMHWTGLYRARWGMQVSKADYAREPLQDEAVAHEERRWIAVKAALAEGMRRSDLELGLWHNYDLLQAWDLLSLFVCLIDHTPADAEPLPVAATLKQLDRPPGPRTLDGVPLRIGGERVQLTLTAVAPGVVSVDPYPFDAPQIDWRATAKAIPDRPYRDADDARAALAAAEPVIVSCRTIRA